MWCIVVPLHKYRACGLYGKGRTHRSIVALRLRCGAVRQGEIDSRATSGASAHSRKGTWPEPRPMLNSFHDRPGNACFINSATIRKGAKQGRHHTSPSSLPRTAQVAATATASKGRVSALDAYLIFHSSRSSSARSSKWHFFPPLQQRSPAREGAIFPSRGACAARPPPHCTL